jgi:hypothetical protein
MYVLIENEQYVHLGPINWNQRMFTSHIAEDLEIDISLPKQYESAAPIVINDNFKILPATLVYPSAHNSKIEQYAGPFWSVVDNTAIGTFTNSPKNIDVVRSDLKIIIANNRWREETKGITINIQGQDVFVTTTRGERDIFLQSLQLMQPTDTRLWKFNTIWLTLTHVDMQTIVSAIVNHIQAAFDWDNSKHIEIDSSQTLEDLDKIQLTIAPLIEMGNVGRMRRNAI